MINRLFLIALFYSVILGQNVDRDIVGSVLDMDNLEPLPYANVIVQGTSRGVTSDADGHFVLVDVPAEPCTLIVSYIGGAQTHECKNPCFLSSEIPLHSINDDISLL